MSKQITTKEGAYGHRVDIDVDDEGKCDLCGTAGKVLLIDTSEEEYALLQICKECVVKEFDNATGG